MRYEEHIGRKYSGLSMVDGLVDTGEVVIRCRDCVYGSDCERRMGLADKDNGYCSDGRPGWT